MSNMIRIEMQKEFPIVINNGELIEAEEAEGIDVYVCCNEIKAWIGNCINIESLEKIVSEKELINSIECSVSEYELECLIPNLECNDYKYDFFGTLRTAIKE